MNPAHLFLSAITGAALCGCAAVAPAAPNGLLGADLDEVRARLGPPVWTCCGASGTWFLCYRDADGTPLPQAVVVTDEVVIAVDPRARPNGAADRCSRWLGAPIEAVVAELGPGADIVQSTSSTQVRFGDVQFTIVDGRVAGAKAVAAAASSD